MTMMHCTLEQLVALRDGSGDTDPGFAEAREHLGACAHCRAEADRLEQRVARLKSLPVLMPARDRFAEVQARVADDRKLSRFRWASISGLATAAGLIGALLWNPQPVQGSQQLSQVMNESRLLEGELARLDTERRAMDGVTAQVAGQLQTRIAAIDEKLQAAELATTGPLPETQLIELWRERVGLMDALVDVHVTGASQVGL